MRHTCSKQLHRLLPILALLLLTACAAERPRIFYPPPPEEPKIEFIGVYSSQNDFPKGPVKRFIEAIIGQEPAAGFKSPYGIAADSRGLVYVSDMHLHNLRVYDFARKEVSFYSDTPIFDQPRGLTIDAQDNLYVADGSRSHVVVFDAARNPVRIIGGRDELQYPVAVAVNDRLQRVYVSDARAHQILVYDMVGKKLFSFGGKGGEVGKFFTPQGVAVAPDDSIFVADMLNSRVQKFDADGRFLHSFGERGDAVFQFENPKGVAFDSEGNLWVADNRRSSIYTYTPDGTLLLATGSVSRSTNLLGFSNPVAIFIDRNDRIYVSDMLNKRFSVWQFMSERYKQAHPVTEADVAKVKAIIEAGKEKEEKAAK